MNIPEQIRSLDAAIQCNDKKLKEITHDEENLIRVAETALEKERVMTGIYYQGPSDKNQKRLQEARDFSISCQTRKNIYKNHSQSFLDDNKELHSKRKTLLRQLVNQRSQENKDKLETEREKLLKELYPKAIRLLLLTSHLEGLNILQLDLNRIFMKHNESFKSELEEAKKSLTDLLEEV